MATCRPSGAPDGRATGQRRPENLARCGRVTRGRPPRDVFGNTFFVIEPTLECAGTDAQQQIKRRQTVERNEIHRIINRPDLIKEQFNTGREDLILGLRIAKEFIEMHGGKIWAESSEDKRNIFCFSVPKSGALQEVSAEPAVEYS